MMPNIYHIISYHVISYAQFTFFHSLMSIPAHLKHKTINICIFMRMIIHYLFLKITFWTIVLLPAGLHHSFQQYMNHQAGSLILKPMCTIASTFPWLLRFGCLDYLDLFLSSHNVYILFLFHHAHFFFLSQWIHFYKAPVYNSIRVSK